MAMLAGPKRKQKWILNPNAKNHHWAKDANKFGQKMLEKMGWTEGKGLGRKEDGVTDHIKVKCRNDQKGMGFKDSVEWSVQQDNYKMLLEELSSSGNHADADVKKTVQQVKSLEEKSQNSRARVHYRKFTRGKDLSRYSEKQLANIFGKKKLTTEAVEVKQESDAEDKKFGVETHTGGSMVDYFKDKKQIKLQPPAVCDSEGEQASFGFGFSSKSTSSHLNFSNGGIEETKLGKKFKKYKNMFVSSTSTGSDDTLTTNQLDETSKKRKSAVEADEVADTSKQKKPKLEEEPEPSKKPKKSKRKTKDEAPTGETSLGLTNPAFEPLYKNFTINKHTLETITEDVADELNHSTTSDDLRTKKKKLKSKTEAIKSCLEIPSLLQQTTEVKFEQNPYEVQPKRKKKSKKDDSSSFAIDNPTFSLNLALEHDVTPQEFEVKRKKTKKSKGLDNDSSNVSNSDSTCTTQQLEASQSEKNIGDSNSFAFVNPTFGLNLNTFPDCEPKAQGYEVKRKKKKRSEGLDNNSLNVSNLGSTLTSLQLEEAQSEIGYELKQKKKKKSKHGLDNPTLNISDSSFSLSTSQLENDLDQNSADYEVKRKKKKSKGLENFTADVSDLSLSTSTAQTENKCLQNGIENSALEISDCDIMLNVTDEPVKTSITSKTNKRRSKNVRFSNTNQEYIINNNYSTEDVHKRNELYDINTQVIQASLKKHSNSSSSGLVNHGFDIKSIDRIDFCDDGSKRGIDNRAFDAKAQNVQESVDLLSKNIDQFQAEVENGINESKDVRSTREGRMIGELGSLDRENEKHEEGSILRIKHAKFCKQEAVWTVRNDASATYPKKSYKHLIRGDIIVKFKNTNLHEIHGYGLMKKSR